MVRNHRTAKQRSNRVLLLAFFLRYGLPVGVGILAVVVGRITNSGKAVVLALGVGCILMGLYELLGYLLKWKHVYCAYQNEYHQDMTPDMVNWRKVRKCDAYGVPIIFIVLGIACVAAAVFGG